MKEIIKEARNVEEAIELACSELGVERDTIDFEIINLPKRGFLGLRNTPARVRVTVPEAEPAVKPRAPQPPRPAAAPQPSRPAAPQPSRPAVAPQPSKPAAPQAGEAKPQMAPRPPRAPRPEPQNRPFESLTPAVPLTFVDAETVDGKARVSADYLRAVLAEMGVVANISVAQTENGIVLRLSGDGLGVIIGRRGETLDALQYLSGLVANRSEGDYIRVTIDSGNYREKRERTLEQLAQKLSAAAIRYGRASTLEPMNPYERRIIHATVSKIDGCSSTSIGEEPNRRVVITPANLKPQNRAPRPPMGGNRKPPRREDKPFAPRPASPDAPIGTRPAFENSERPETRAEILPENRPVLRPNENKPGDFRGNDRAPRQDRPPFNRGGNRPPFRDGGDRPPFNRAPRPDGAKPTPTAVDRAYALELEKDPPVFVKPEGADTAPTRPQTREAEELPLYGKIEL